DFRPTSPVRSPRAGAKRPDHRSRLSVEQLEERSLLTASISLGFAAMNINDTSGGTPPDTVAAAGPTAVGECVNTALAYYDKAGNLLAPIQQLATFFNTSNLQSDPRVYYDDAAHRFVVSILDIDTTNNREWLDVGFSNDANPLDGWQIRKIELTES